MHHYPFTRGRPRMKYCHLTVIFCALAVAGVVCRLANIAENLLETVSVVLSVLLLFGVSLKVLRRNVPATKLALILILLLAWVPLGFYMYAKGRGEPLAPSYGSKSGAFCLVEARVDSVETDEAGETILVTSVRSLQFPQKCPASGVLRLKCKARFRLVDCATQMSVPLTPAKLLNQCIVAQIRAPTPARSDHRSQFLFRANRCFYPSAIWTLSEVASAQGTVDEAKSIFDRSMAEARARLVEMHRKILGRNGDVLASMVLGDKAVKLDKSITGMFRDVGLSHVLAASGFNLTVVVAMTYFVASILIRSSSIVYLACFLNLLCFVGLAGPSPSVVRAAIMCSIMLALKMTRIAAEPLAVLSVALLASLLFDPYCLTDIGLQLSYAATAGLIIISGPIAKLLTIGDSAFAAWTAESVAVVCASQAMVLPIQLNCFWQLGLLFGPANLIVVPILAPITILGFLSSGLELAKPLAGPFGQALFQICVVVDYLANVPLSCMLWYVEWLYSFHDAVMKVGAPPLWATWFYVVALGIMAASLRLKRFRTVGVATYAISLFAIIYRPPLVQTEVICARGSLIVIAQNRIGTFIPLREISSPAEKKPPRKTIQLRETNLMRESSQTLATSPLGGCIADQFPRAVTKLCGARGLTIQGQPREEVETENAIFYRWTNEVRPRSAYSGDRPSDRLADRPNDRPEPVLRHQTQVRCKSLIAVTSARDFLQREQELLASNSNAEFLLIVGSERDYDRVAVIAECLNRNVRDAAVLPRIKITALQSVQFILVPVK